MMKPQDATWSVVRGFKRFQSLPAGNLLCLRRLSIFYPNRFTFLLSFPGLLGNRHFFDRLAGLGFDYFWRSIDRCGITRLVRRTLYRVFKLAVITDYRRLDGFDHFG